MGRKLGVLFGAAEVFFGALANKNGMVEVTPLNEVPLPPALPSPPEPEPEIDPATFNLVSDYIKVTSDADVMYHTFPIDNWSFRTKEDGEFIAPQGLPLVPCIFQAINKRGEKLVMKGGFQWLDFSPMRFAVKEGKYTHIMYLGKADNAYDQFWMKTALAKPLDEASFWREDFEEALVG